VSQARHQRTDRRTLPRPTDERAGSATQVAPIELSVERLVAGGDGLARHPDGRVVFVPGVVAGERVSAQLLTSKRDFATARLVEVLEASPDRRPEPCPAVARGCGGCDWQHVDPMRQLAAKAEIVREALRRTGRVAEPLVTIGGAVPASGYRTGMRVAIDAGGRAALRRPRSNELVALEGCLVAHPQLDALLEALHAPGADEVSLRVSVATGEATALADPPTTVLHGLPSFVAGGPDARLFEHVAGVRFQVSAGSFFQSGPAAAELLVATVAAVASDALSGARHVVDAYGGVGLFSATIAGPDARITLVESSPSACADARVNLVGRDAMVVESTVEHWDARPSGRGDVDVLVADPARAGLGPDGVRRIVETGAATVVLVSCDPVAGARDAAGLVSSGWRLTSTTVLDLFPHTHHVETVSRFDRER
jgi:23S rRNA (uracil1939-C5)-methyltransferase